MALLSLLKASETAILNIEENDVDCAESAIPIITNNIMAIDVQKIIAKVSKLQPILECSDCTALIHSKEIFLPWNPCEGKIEGIFTKRIISHTITL
ncbi:hypothetical protein ABEB36_000249 [Hypothenemus hampei]